MAGVEEEPLGVDNSQYILSMMRSDKGKTEWRNITIENLNLRNKSPTSQTTAKWIAMVRVVKIIERRTRKCLRLLHNRHTITDKIKLCIPSGMYAESNISLDSSQAITSSAILAHYVHFFPPILH